MNGRNGKKSGSGRDSGGFIALPWSVVDSGAFEKLSHPAARLLVLIARQYVRDNNGRLLASIAFLAKRGWKSHDVITRATRELIDAGLIHMTVQGQRPNKASWYAVTWQNLDRHPGYDPGAVESFVRSAYRRKNAGLSPSGGIERPSIVPSGGIERAPPIPSGGTIRGQINTFSIPSGGNHLEIPSACIAEPAPASGFPACDSGNPPARTQVGPHDLQKLAVNDAGRQSGGRPAKRAGAKNVKAVAPVVKAAMPRKAGAA